MYHLNLDKALLLPRNLVIFLETFDGFLLPQSLIISAEILHTFPTYQCLQKVFFRIFLFCLDPELLINLVSVSVQKPGLFKHPFERIGKQETRGSWSSIFQTNLPGFSESVEPCLNFWDFVLLNKYYQITKTISPCKPILF